LIWFQLLRGLISPLSVRLTRTLALTSLTPVCPTRGRPIISSRISLMQRWLPSLLILSKSALPATSLQQLPMLRAGKNRTFTKIQLHQNPSVELGLHGENQTVRPLDGLKRRISLVSQPNHQGWACGKSGRLGLFAGVNRSALRGLFT